MKLSEMSLHHLATKGEVIGFIVKSLKSNKLFKTIAKSPGGSYLVESISEPGTEFLLRGDVDRYEFAADDITKARILELKAELTALDQEIQALGATLDTKESHYNSVLKELESIDDDYDTCDYDSCGNDECV